MFILLAGMTFQSGVTLEGSGAHTVLTVLVALVLVGCVALFVAMLGHEVWSSVRFASRQRRIRAAASGQRPRVPVVDGSSPSAASRVSSGSAQAALWTLNPLKGEPTTPVLPPPLAALPPPPPPPGPPPPPDGSSSAMGAAQPAPGGHDKGINRLSAAGLGSQRHGRVTFVARANSVRAAAASEACGIVPEAHMEAHTPAASAANQ
jgi:hypothetical protein